MADVAKRANVSKMTVSRVLNGTGYVKEETRAAIEQAIAELHYRPNLLAKALTTGKTNLIAYVLTDISDPFFANTCKGVTQECTRVGYTTVVYNAETVASIDSFVSMAVDRNLDGVIFHHLDISQQLVDCLLEHGIETALIDNERVLQNASNVYCSDYHGGVMAAQLLYEKNYRRIVCVQGSYPDGMRVPYPMSYTEQFQKKIWEERTAGFYDTLRALDLPLFGVYYGSGSAPPSLCFQRGQQIAREILQQDALPDAIYCESDLIALGILGELLESKIDVPNTISLIGHDGLDVCRYLYPRITTVVMPQFEAGRVAAQCLLRRIRREAGYQNAELLPTLFYGDTTRS